MQIKRQKTTCQASEKTRGEEKKTGTERTTEDAASISGACAHDQPVSLTARLLDATLLVRAIISSYIDTESRACGAALHMIACAATVTMLLAASEKMMKCHGSTFQIMTFYAAGISWINQFEFVMLASILLSISRSFFACSSVFTSPSCAASRSCSLMVSTLHEG